jgi:hypothetical protein
VPEVEKAYGVVETGLLEYGLEVACVAVVAVDGRADLRGKDQSVVLPEPLDPFALLELSLPVTPERLYRPGGQLDGSAALGGLGRGEVALYKIRVT